MSERPSRIRSTFKASPAEAEPVSRVRINVDQPAHQESRVRINVGAPSETVDSIEQAVETGEALGRRSRVRGNMARAAVGESVQLPEVVEGNVETSASENLPQEGDTIRRVRQPNQDGSNNDSLYRVRNVGKNDRGETVIRLKNDRGVRRTIPLSEFTAEPNESGSYWHAEEPEE